MRKTPSRFHEDMIIGEVLSKHPGAAKIIEKYFSGGCFPCSGMRMESITLGAMMHDVDPEVIIKELNELE